MNKEQWTTSNEQWIMDKKQWAMNNNEQGKSNAHLELINNKQSTMDN